MKQVTIIFLFTLLFTNILTAQSKFHIGVIAGGGLTGWNEKLDNQFLEEGRVIKHEFTSGYAIGVFSEYKLWNRFTLNAELLYLKSGSTFIDKTDGVIHASTGNPFTRIEEIKYNVNNFQMPVFLSVELSNSRFIPYIKLGIVANYILDGTRDYYSFLSTTNETKNTNIELQLNTNRNRDLRFEIKPLIGIGIVINERFSLESILSIGKPFSYSLVPDDFDCPDICNTYETSYNNRSLLLMLKYKLK